MDKGLIKKITLQLQDSGIHSRAIAPVAEHSPKTVYFGIAARVSPGYDKDSVRLVLTVWDYNGSSCFKTPEEALDTTLDRLNRVPQSQKQAICVVKYPFSLTRWDEWRERWVPDGLSQGTLEDGGWEWFTLSQNEFGIYYLDPDDDD